MIRIDYREAIDRCGVMQQLVRFDPHVVGTPPLGIDLPDSDIDIVCEVGDHSEFRRNLGQAFENKENLSIRHNARLDATICGFTAEGWTFEIFGQSIPVARQHGWRHFLIERRLLALGGEGLRTAILALRRSGLKTEPAFARLLELDGDPYAAILALETLGEAELGAILPCWRDDQTP